MLAVALVAAALPAGAARPLLDSGKWNAYFALFARDTQVPWKRIGVRLDTYSGAPVDFAAYEVDPADVLVAGADARPRAIDTARRRPVVRWRFTPPPGLQFETSDVEVPLRNREGFFVVEARRGDAAQQVWLDISRIGLVTKESPGGLELYGADLGTGRALAGMRVTYLVGTSFVYGATDAHGIARVAGGRRPRFALAEWGASKAFVSIVPVSPVPSDVVGVRVDRGVVRAGERLRVVGFVRRRVGATMRAATGDVHVSMVARGRTLASVVPRLDAAGAFGAAIDVPLDTPAGDVAVLAVAGGATGGATVHVDAAGDAVLTIAAPCGAACPADTAFPVAITAESHGIPLAARSIRVRVVRTPHVLPPGAPRDDVPWATTTIIDQRYTTDANGVAHVSIPGPSDGLASTYGIEAVSGAATASAGIVTPTARLALSIVPQTAQLDLAAAATFQIGGFDALDGTPAAGRTVRVRLVHGPNVQSQSVTLDRTGRATATFRNLVPGTSLAFADADDAGAHAVDATAITVVPTAQGGGGAQTSDDVHIALDKPRYRVGDRITVRATLAGAAGDAFVTLDGVRPIAAQTVGVRGGAAQATLTLPETVGDVSVGVTFVRDGATYVGTERVPVDAPGHPRAMTLVADAPAYAPGAKATIAIDDGGMHDGATLVVRLGDGRPALGASFDDAPGVLSTAGTTSQSPSSADPAWHTGVAPARSTAGDIFGFDRPRASAPADVSLAAASPRSLVWRVERGATESIAVPLPNEKGTYVVSVMKISDDGDVGAASASLTVQ